MRREGFIEVSQNLTKYRFKNNFIVKIKTIM